MWRRRSRRLTVALTLAACVAGGGSAYAAWSATTSPPSASFSGAPDWTPPAVTSTQIQKSTGWSAGYVKPGGTYYVYSQVAADTGNPASGIGSVTAGLSNLTSGQTAAALTAGTYSSQGSSFNYRAGPFTVGSPVTEGNKTYTVTTRDTAANTLTTPGQTVVVDGTPPTGTAVQTTRSGGTAGKAETGDALVLTFSEPMDPGSLISGWDGTSRNVTLEIVNGSGSAADTIQLFNGTTQLTGVGSITLPDKSYVKKTVDFTNSPMVLSGSTLTVTLGSTSSSANVTTGGAGTTTWIPSAALFDRAGNALSSTTVTESGASDAEF